MNKLLMSILIFLSAFSLCLVSSISIKNITEKSCEMIETTENSLNDSEKLENSFKKFNDFWEKKSKILAMILHHQHLDEIDHDVAKLKIAIEKNSELEILESCECIKSRMKSTNETDNISLQNIF